MVSGLKTWLPSPTVTVCVEGGRLLVELGSDDFVLVVERTASADTLAAVADIDMSWARAIPTAQSRNKMMPNIVFGSMPNRDLIVDNQRVSTVKDSVGRRR